MRATLTYVKRSDFGYRDTALTIGREAWSLYRRCRGSRDVRGALAAWAADKYLLGEGAEVWPASDDGFTPGGAAYVRKLRATLAGYGYTKLTGS